MHIHVVSYARWKRRLGGCLLLATAGAVLAYPQAISTGVSRGLSLCGGVVIPSLFVFMVLSSVCIRTGLGTAVGRRMARGMHALFGLSGEASTAWLISLVGGYPSGAAAVRELLDNGDITVSQGKRLLRGCVNAGPAFVIGGVGAGMLGSPQKGLVLFAAQLLASLLTGILCCRGRDSSPPSTRTAPPTPFATALVESIHKTCANIVPMCGFVILATAVLSLMDATGMTALLTKAVCWLPSRWGISAAPLSAVFAGIIEVSCGCVEATGAGGAMPLLLGLIIGWGGLSVHGQVRAVTAPYSLIDRDFFMARGLQAALTGCISVLLFRFIPLPDYVWAAGDGTTVQWYTTSVTATAALLLLCGLWLLSLPVGQYPTRNDWKYNKFKE